MKICIKLSNHNLLKLGMNIGIDMLYNLNWGFLNVTDGYHGNHKKGITMVMARKNKYFEKSLTTFTRNIILNIVKILNHPFSIFICD